MNCYYNRVLIYFFYTCARTLLDGGDAGSV
jgi:hypothetical protein